MYPWSISPLAPTKPFPTQHTNGRTPAYATFLPLFLCIHFCAIVLYVYTDEGYCVVAEMLLSKVENYLVIGAKKNPSRTKNCGQYWLCECRASWDEHELGDHALVAVYVVSSIETLVVSKQHRRLQSCVGTGQDLTTPYLMRNCGRVFCHYTIRAYARKYYIGDLGACHMSSRQ